MGTSTIPAVKTMPVFTEATLDARIPSGPIEQKWEKHKFEMKNLYEIDRLFSYHSSQFVQSSRY